MKLNNQLENNTSVRFQNLSIGDVYEDNEGVICIKTSNDDYGDSPYGKCIALVDGVWCEEDEHRESRVKPIEATIRLHRYK